MFRASRLIVVLSLVVLASLVLASFAPSAAFAGAVSGPRAGSGDVPAFDRVTYSPIYFRGGEVARVAVVGDHDTDLDLYVLDVFGNIVAQDNDGTDVCLAAWVP